MEKDRSFVYITVGDMIARSAYQMGKTPLLPIFAASLGASETYLGIIVSVSTLTGMLLKPFIGSLSDRWGRRAWLLAGTVFFAFMPFMYWLVETPTQLLIIRLIHGIATAIYGPVTLAYITERWPGRRALRLGWFGTARSIGYIIGPGVGGWLLLSFSPQWIFTLIGFLSILVFIPILALRESAERREIQPEMRKQISSSLLKGAKTPAVWLSGGLEAAVYVATYAIKAFLPIYGLMAGVSIAVIGVFFSIQEGSSLLLKPLGGWLADRYGYARLIVIGMIGLGAVLPFLALTEGALELLLLAMLMGAAQAMIFPATTALVSMQIDRSSLGAGMGLMGTLRNAGKVLGPLVGGVLVHQLGFDLTFLMLGVFLWLGAILLSVKAGLGKFPSYLLY